MTQRGPHPVELAQALQRLVVYGAGEHGQVVAEAAQLAGHEVLGFVDDAPGPQVVCDWPRLARDDSRLAEAGFIVAIGDNALREQVSHRLADEGVTLVSVVHPSACVSPSASLGAGVFVGPLAVVHTRALLGPGVIVNSGAVVEHGNILGPFAHVAPGAALGGSVTLGAGTLVGLGARILPGLEVGDASTVGAGAVVTCSIGPHQTVVGIPAQ